MQLHQGIMVTKLYPPAARSGLISRRRLGETLVQRGLPRLVLVTAAAGYGKTTLLAQWFDFLRRADYQCAWFSIDQSDSEPAEFLRYLITALRSGVAGLGEESLRTLESRSQIDPGEIVVELINEIAKAGREIAVFLDDFHNIDSAVVSKIVGAFIAHGPSNLHFLLASRSMPDLPVASLRAHAEVVNISAEDLRFNADEAARFLRDARGLDLSDDQVNGLFDRTEGWVAGLQLASLSLDQNERRDEFIHSFSGEARDVAEYLALDVLNRLPPDLQEFLLHTSILERMSSESCRCLVSRDDCQDVLDRLEGSNTFLLPLDEKRTWYRYHHLFREFLLGQLRRRQPEAIRDLYHRASLWFAAQGCDNEAVTYALESGDFDQAAILVEQHATRLLKRGQMPRLYHWLQKLPDAIIERRPQLPMLRCWALFHMNRPEEAAQALHQAEDVIARQRDRGPGQENRELDALEEEMKVLYAGVACVHDDVEVLEQLASEPLREGLIQPFHLGAMYNMLGYSRLVKGEFEPARDALAKSRRYHEQAGSSFGLAYCGIFSGMLNRIQGKLHSAAAEFRQAEDASILDSGERSAGAAVARLMQGVVLYEWNRIDEAERLIVANIGLVEECTIAEALVLGYVTLARIRSVQGHRDGAEQCYTKIRAICERRNFRRLLLLVENDFVRTLINQGDVAAAERVASRLNIGMDGEQDALTDCWEAAPCLEVLIRARILRARGEPDRALKDLRRLRNLAVRAGRIRLSIEILTLMALAEFERGAKAPMGKNILAVLNLSPSSGFVRIFLDEGENIGPMLQWLQDHSGSELPAPASYQLQSILAAFADPGQAAGNPDDRPDVRQGLVEELSARELEVLELMVSGRSNGQIGAQLEIAESTVKWHAKNIFGKLGVKNRTSAALAAQQLRLIGHRTLL
ncbi:MAG TPA: LuxR C-terminal-related transcriptional regulator [Xanthomonadales bacterium]|nr:LuxR C-terminal-related transcriptional regulator [Xanthomonadales bacterium]